MREASPWSPSSAVDERPGRAQEQDRVARAGVTRRSAGRDRCGAVAAAASARASRTSGRSSGWSPSTMNAPSTTAHRSRAHVRPTRSDEREAALGSGLTGAILAGPVDRPLDRVGAVAEHDDGLPRARARGRRRGRARAPADRRRSASSFAPGRVGEPRARPRPPGRPLPNASVVALTSRTVQRRGVT